MKPSTVDALRTVGALTAGIAAADVWLLATDRTTFTSASWTLMDDPYWRWPLVALWAGLTFHLFGEWLLKRAVR